MAINEESNVLGDQVQQVMNQVQDPLKPEEQNSSDGELAQEIEAKAQKRKRKAKKASKSQVSFIMKNRPCSFHFHAIDIA